MSNSCKSGTPILDESRMIAEYLEKNGDPTRCQTVCMKADELVRLLGTNVHIIDIRSGQDFKARHIPSAVNVPIEKFQYHLFKTHKGLMFDKVVIVCETGTASAFAASLMRQYGFDNVHVLEWGMAGWNPECSGPWAEVINKPVEIALSKEPLTINEEQPSPKIKTGKLWREDILNERIRQMLKTGFRGVAVGPEALQNKEALIIAYCSKEDYDQGHPEGAVHFPLGESMHLKTMLKLLPPDKEIILYSRNGFESAYACAYLRVLGYNAKNLMFGMNNFMMTDEMREGPVYKPSAIPRYTLLGNTVLRSTFDKAPEVKPTPDKDKKEVPKPKTIELKQKVLEAEPEGC